MEAPSRTICEKRLSGIMRKFIEKLKNNMYYIKNACFFIKRAYNLNPAGVLVKIPEVLFKVLLKFLPILLVRNILNSIQLRIDTKTVLIWIILYSLLLLICKTLDSWINIFTERQISKTNRIMRMDLTNRINKLSYDDVEKPETRTLLQMLEDNISIPKLLNSIASIVTKVLVLSGTIAIICTLEPFIILLIMSVLIVRVVINKLSRILWNKWRLPVNDKMRKVNYFLKVLRDPSYGKEIRINGLQEWISSKMKDAEKEYIHTMSDYNKQLQSCNAFSEIAVVLQELIVYLLLAYRVFFCGLLIGDYSMYISGISTFSSSFSSIIDSFSDILQAGDFLTLYREISEKNEQKQEVCNMEVPDVVSLKFDHVSFHYPNTSRLILDDICLDIESGQSLSLIGLNGAGKTTLIKLLCRFYSPTAGAIYLNGVEISTIPSEVYQKILGVVFQDYKLFAFTVEENVSLSDIADKEHLYSSLSKCGLKEKVEALPKKEDTAMGKIIDNEGVEFSGGESQRIELCKVLYKDSPLVILDEPTASLDPFKEYELYKMIYGYTKDKCSIFISHRLASAQFTDYIAVMKGGKIVEYGSFDELLAIEDGVFKELFELQSSYYKR